jgi:hypothetical protein
VDQTRGKGATIDVGVLAPCTKWRECKIPRTMIGGQFIVERMGHSYWAGTVFCLRCSHHIPVDLFEDKDSKIVAPDKQAEQIIGPNEEVILEAILK